LARPATAATAVNDPMREFSFTVPDGFVESPGGSREAKLGLTFTLGDLGKPGFIVLQVASLGGTIGRGKIVPAIVEKAARNSANASGVELTSFEYRQVKWSGFDLDLVVSHARKDGKSILTLNTQVPLAREAIQLSMAGGKEDEARLHFELQSILASLKGRSSWLTDAERSERLGFNVGAIAGTAGVVVVALFLSLRRRAPRPAAKQTRSKHR
jgi:hypothetical protein